MIENTEKSISDQLDLILPPGYNLNLSLKKINFSVDLQKAQERRILNLPVELLHIPKYREATLQPSNISVLVFGAESLVNQISSDQIKVTIDGAKTKRKEMVKLPVFVELPPDIHLKKAEPDSIEVFVK